MSATRPATPANTTDPVTADAPPVNLAGGVEVVYVALEGFVGVTVIVGVTGTT